MRRLAILAAGAALLGAASAHASGVPSVGFPLTAYSETVGSQFNLGAGTVLFAGNTASAGFVGTPTVSVSGNGATATADAEAKWEFFVDGQAPNGPVPILITGSYSMNTVGAGFAFGNVNTGDSDRDLVNNLHVECSSGLGHCTSPGGGQDFAIHIQVLADSYQEVNIQAGGLGHGVSQFYGMIDPMISFDLSSGYDFSGLTLDVAPDAQPPVTGGGVPEPASWALMISGFGLAGAALRRRRAVVAA
jgi:hypothetical protein